MVKVSAYDSTKQPKPIKNDTPPVWDYVIEDIKKSIENPFTTHLYQLTFLMEKRKEFGFNKYGTYLQANNGRNSKEDLLQELLDAVAYAKQLEIENKDVHEFAYIAYQLECILKENFKLLTEDNVNG